MTCAYHATPVEDCVGCAGRWDRAMAERAIADYSIGGIALATLRMAIAQLDRADVVIRQSSAALDALTIARNEDRTEWMTTYATMRAEIETLRFCDNLGLFADNELEPAQADAFREHLTHCERCRERLIGLAQEHATLSDWAPQQCTAAIACPREDCVAARGERCKTDRPLHVERWDAWKAAGFPERAP